jgi:hypothetical protein
MSNAQSLAQLVNQVPGRNRIINGGLRVDQRNGGGAQTITAAAALAYTVDRWWGACTGANVTGQQVSASAGIGAVKQYQFTGAASVTGIQFGQRIEATNSADLAGQTATFSVTLANSLLTSVTWAAYYATTADAFGTLASPTKTQIATGTFNVTNAMTRYQTQIAVPAAATTGIEIVLSVGAQTSGTWSIANAKFELGTKATTMEPRPLGEELLLCQRYYYVSPSASYGFPSPGSTYAYDQRYDFKASMRAVPTVSTSHTNMSGLSTITTQSITTDFYTAQYISNVNANATWTNSFTASAEL